MVSRVGSFEVIESKFFLVPKGEGIWTEVNTVGWNVKMNIIFDETAPAPSVEVRPVEDYAEILFKKWDSMFGMATAAPVQIGVRADGRVLKFMAAVYQIGEIKKVELQFLLGGVK